MPPPASPSWSRPTASSSRRRSRAAGAFTFTRPLQRAFRSAAAHPQPPLLGLTGQWRQGAGPPSGVIPAKAGIQVPPPLGAAPAGRPGSWMQALGPTCRGAKEGQVGWIPACAQWCPGFWERVGLNGRRGLGFRPKGLRPDSLSGDLPRPRFWSCPDLIRASIPLAFRQNREETAWIAGSSPAMTMVGFGLRSNPGHHWACAGMTPSRAVTPPATRRIWAAPLRPRA